MQSSLLRASTAALAVVLLTLSIGPPAGADEAPALDPKEQAKALIAAFKDEDAGARLRAAEAAAGLQESSLTPALLRLLTDEEWSVRQAAIRSLAAREGESDRKKAASGLAGRLARLGRHPADREELMASIEALGALRQRHVIKALLDDIDLESDLEEVEARLFAVAAIPHADAVEALIDFLAKGRRGGRQKQRALAHKALRHLTGESSLDEHATAGRDADRWRAWWKDHKKSIDLEAVAAARAEAEAERAAQAERKREKAEERKQKRAERKRKKKDAPPPEEKGQGARVD